ncbi:LAGLIDADG family homing endonuclease [Bacillus sp. Marseille-P3800]|uniref:LAGLIDADG family homing endonuclease n=1 Tax=Bacillus sp. Marseille-P3800 TaxID=2014782 RepID=UPI000C08547F|nr:LAGLIDADG family homing endonuclease [Bacillus sp. Marseille-P3800]
MKSIFTDEELQFIKGNFNKMTYKELTEQLNSFNDIKKDDKQVRTKAATMGLSKRKYKYDNTFFETINTEEKAYWLGFVYADGWITKSKNGAELGIELGIIDKKHLFKFNHSIKGNYQVFETLKPKSIYNGLVFKERTTSRIRIYSTKYFKDLKNLGVLPDKTNKTNHPIIEGDFFMPFLRGFLDGDGCIYSSRMVHLTNANENFLKYIKVYLSSNYNIEARLYKEKDKKYRLLFSKKHSVSSLLSHLYENSTIHLDRKYNLYKELTLENKLAV